jgi:hypothetical protein
VLRAVLDERCGVRPRAALSELLCGLARGPGSFPGSFPGGLFLFRCLLMVVYPATGTLSHRPFIPYAQRKARRGSIPCEPTRSSGLEGR